MPDGDLFEGEDANSGRERPAARNRLSEDRIAQSGADTSGHRARQRKRLLDGGTDALADHEIVE